MNKIEQKFLDVSVNIAGLGHYFPGEPITNKQLNEKYGFDEEWIVEHTGVKQRHWADDTRESFVDMAKKAVESALENANMQKEEIDILICTSSTARPVVNPSTFDNKYMDIAPPLQHAVGLINAFCFDLTAVACLGFVECSMTASSLLAALNKKNALVVCVESPSKILNYKYKNSTLFGAGAAAVIWKKCEKEENKLIDVVMHSDGSYFNAFDIDDNNKIIMKGKQVGNFAPIALTEVSKEIFERNNISVEDVDWFIPHQANINIINELQKSLNIPEEKLLINIDVRGNTSSVGGPSCFSENVYRGKIKKGDLIFICSIGRGYSWGGILFKY